MRFIVAPSATLYAMLKGNHRPDYVIDQSRRAFGQPTPLTGKDRSLALTEFRNIQALGDNGLISDFAGYDKGR